MPCVSTPYPHAVILSGSEESMHFYLRATAQMARISRFQQMEFSPREAIALADGSEKTDLSVFILP